MKPFVLITCFLLSLTTFTQAQERIIEQPPFTAWSSTSIEIDKVALSDTATVLHIKAFYRPKNWIKIASGSFLKGSDGELYPLRHGIGITPDQSFGCRNPDKPNLNLSFHPCQKILPLSISPKEIQKALSKSGEYNWMVSCLS